MSGDAGQTRAETADTGVKVLRAVNLSKTYGGVATARAPVQLFRLLNLQVQAGEIVAIVGRSGAGKSSLLHLLAGLERPTAGEVWVAGQSLQTMTDNELATMRNCVIGFVWQFHYLLPEFSALENVAMPLLSRGTAHKLALTCAKQWLERVGLSHRAAHRSGELSGGEQQRVALARALVSDPAVLLADEPTGDLDDQTADDLFDLIQTLCREQNLAAVLVTHNLEIARRCQRQLQLADGQLQPILGG